MPGLTERRFFCQRPYWATSPGTGGRGPTRLMLPSRTLNNWGSSSMLVFLMNLPTLVIRGSSLILKTGPSISLRWDREALRRSASGIMERYFHIRKRRPFFPTRSWANNAGPGESR